MACSEYVLAMRTFRYSINSRSFDNFFIFGAIKKFIDVSTDAFLHYKSIREHYYSIRDCPASQWSLHKLSHNKYKGLIPECLSMPG